MWECIGESKRKSGGSTFNWLPESVKSLLFFFFKWMEPERRRLTFSQKHFYLYVFCTEVDQDQSRYLGDIPVFLNLTPPTHKQCCYFRKKKNTPKNPNLSPYTRQMGTPSYSTFCFRVIWRKAHSHARAAAVADPGESKNTSQYWKF